MGECYWHGTYGQASCPECATGVDADEETRNKKIQDDHARARAAEKERREKAMLRIRELTKDISDQDLLFIVEHLDMERTCYRAAARGVGDNVEFTILRGVDQTKTLINTWNMRERHDKEWYAKSRDEFKKQ